MHPYSSVSAFLWHYQALRMIPVSARTEDDRNRLTAMDRVLDTLRPEERAAVSSDHDDPTVARHRQRAALRLRRELAALGALDG